jgi:glucose/arabinose dehydrogenase
MGFCLTFRSVNLRSLFRLAWLPLALSTSCSDTKAPPEAGPDARPVEAASCVGAVTRDGAAATFCDLPGSLVFGAGGKVCSVADTTAGAPSLTWLTLPSGYCAHYFAHVTTARQLRFAPGGELFVASPSTITAGGAPVGLGAIVVLYDDNGDGFADGDPFPHANGSPQKLTIFTRDASVQGLMFAPGYFYFQTNGGGPGTQIAKVAYKTGQRMLDGTPSSVADISSANGMYMSGVHWPKTLDMADDGTIYVGNGGDQSQVCNSSVFPRPFTGGVLEIDGTPAGTPVARGFRNPIAIRCEKGKNLCFAAELGLDGSGGEGGREKIVPIRKGDDWGYPCCATTDVPLPDISGTPNCAEVATEQVALVIGNTPFGLDFETGSWPAPYTKNMLVTLHGEVSTWTGARVVAIPMQSDGMPVQSTDLDGGVVPDFATGWDDGTLSHGRPAAIAFAADGRAYIANDVTGDIFWVAPLGLARGR